ncbi:hypothetical protein [Paenibacillus sp. 481]|uniref:hypothetical protein n=1 Tax=Paenibacillus sp. 481 TaxID=2835869 RepID=UPI001E3C6A2F|nr:hypothetical protein [Paenibacillus sp. 481]UHA73522.1 hypothetical protein KIK04_23720 [Paenibacillus sp. 481]
MNLDELRDYSSTLEELLVVKQKKFNQMVDRKARKIPEDELDDFYSTYYHGEGGYKLHERYPDLLRKSVFTSCYFSFEVELINYCKFVKKLRFI